MPPVRRVAPALALLLASDLASAHAQVGVAGGLVSGFSHPLTGLDHLVAMVAVGLWGAQLGAPALWILPLTFPLVMAFGGILGLAGIPLPASEIVIALSGLVLGSLVAARQRVPLPVAALLVAIFAIFHGHAHGQELPTAANPLAYGVGFVTATGLLHLCGIAIGSLSRWSAGRALVQATGGVIAAVGGYFLLAGLGWVS